MNDAFNAGYRFKLSMYWGSKWRTYFGLYYAFTYEAARAALDGYSFPVTKNRGWAIEELSTKEVEFAPRERVKPRIETTELPEPQPVGKIQSVWRASEKGSRRL